MLQVRPHFEITLINTRVNSGNPEIIADVQKLADGSEAFCRARDQVLIVHNVEILQMLAIQVKNVMAGDSMTDQ